jgi:hypothetical protein
MQYLFLVIGLFLVLSAVGFGIEKYPGGPSANGATCGGLAIVWRPEFCCP